MQRVIVDINDRSRVKSAIGIDPVPACGGQLDEPTWELFHGAIKSDENRYNILDFTTGNRNTAQWLNYMVERSRASTNEQAFAGGSGVSQHSPRAVFRKGEDICWVRRCRVL